MRRRPGTKPPHKAVAVNRRRTNFQRRAYSATSNPTEESSHARTQLWTLGQDQDQTAIDREILALFFDQYNNNNTYIALIRMCSKRFTSIVLQYDLEI